jgi:hypothetical protein
MAPGGLSISAARPFYVGVPVWILVPLAKSPVRWTFRESQFYFGVPFLGFVFLDFFGSVFLKFFWFSGEVSVAEAQ